MRRKRIDYFHKKYAEQNISKEQFIKFINFAYYKYSSDLYHNRYTNDIEELFVKQLAKIDEHVNLRNYTVVNIGGGQGFEYFLVNRSGIHYKKYFFIEPDLNMLTQFKDQLTEEQIDKIIFVNSGGVEALSKIKDVEKKIIIINSALHHMINHEEFLEALKSKMNSQDILYLCHEPNNKCSKMQSYLAKCTAGLIRLMSRKQRQRSHNAERWEKIKSYLLTHKIIRKMIPTLIIRRIIDYGVGYKRDLATFNIPSEYDEGFWTIDDLQKIFGSDYHRIVYLTYRHFGDPKSSRLIRLLNNIMVIISPTDGTNMIAAWLKK